MKITHKKKDHDQVSVPTRSQAHPALGLRQGLGNMFDDFFNDFALSPLWNDSWPSLNRGSGGGLQLSPNVDVTENEDAFKVTAELAGLEEKDIDVILDDDRLTIKGEKEEKKDEKEDNYHISERYYGTFERSFGLPKSVDRDHVKASMKNGVLSVTLPKSKEAKALSKKIAITDD